jgi:hypothetical protein
MVFFDEPRRPRRPSTGGKPPVRIREHYVIEEAPSHDDTPCFTAWICVEIVKIPNGYCSSDYTDGNKRPEWSIQIYDTTPGSDYPEHLRGLAEKLHRHTREEREAAGRGRSDRIDIWGIPLATNLTEEERIEKCKRIPWPRLRPAMLQQLMVSTSLFSRLTVNGSGQLSLLIDHRKPGTKMREAFWLCIGM